MGVTCTDHNNLLKLIVLTLLGEEYISVHYVFSLKLCCFIFLKPDILLTSLFSSNALHLCE